MVPPPANEVEQALPASLTQPSSANEQLGPCVPAGHAHRIPLTTPPLPGAPLVGTVLMV